MWSQPTLLLTVALAWAPLASAQRPVKGAPSTLNKDEDVCASGECGANADDLGEYARLSMEELLERTTGIIPLPQFRDLVAQSIEPLPTDELHEAITRKLGFVQRHVESEYVRKTFPDALSYTMSKAGNYSDGTPAGTEQWIGDVGAQDEEDPTYASFGSVLDVAAPSATANTLAWMASLVHREEMVQDSDDDHPRPCRTDLIDDYYQDSFSEPCLMGVTLDEYVSVRPDEETVRKDVVSAAEYGIADKGQIVVNTNRIWIKGGFLDGKKFDTIFADGVLTATEDLGLHDMDLVVEKLASYLKPGGTLYLIGTGPTESWEEFADEPGEVYHDTMDVYNAIKGLAGEHPTSDLPAEWVHRTATRLGLTVFGSTLFQKYTSYEDIRGIVSEANEYLREIDTQEDVKKIFLTMLLDCLDRAQEATQRGPVYAGGQSYIIAAGLPSPEQTFRKVEQPEWWEPKMRYEYDQDPTIEKLALPDLEPGVMETFKWANGDDYDGLGARIGLPTHLAETIRNYVKDLGIWDLMVDTIYNDPMPLNSTRFYTVTSPYGNGERNLTWSAKRPDNFYGSDSDMHWFDVADEAAHEDALRALAKGGFDEILNAIGTYLGLDHLVSFSIGLLAVTKADKGYVHVDFSNSDSRAFNFLINLHTPDDDPEHTELTVIEEDEVGNRRRGQVKYSPNFGVLNGDDAMHATNECNHRASKGVRITASIFISELKEASLEQVAEHDKYYFPFGNMEWIWAQRGRHWNKEGTVSLANDKGRVPFEPKDEMEGCKERVGEKKEKCLVHSLERMLCYDTCGSFVSDDDFRPGEERRNVVGW